MHYACRNDIHQRRETCNEHNYCFLLTPRTSCYCKFLQDIQTQSTQALIQFLTQYVFYIRFVMLFSEIFTKQWLAYNQYNYYNDVVDDHPFHGAWGNSIVNLMHRAILQKNHSSTMHRHQQQRGLHCMRKIAVSTLHVRELLWH